MDFTSYIALRFVRSRRSGFVSFITVIAVLGITIAVMVLDVTLAVMNGFRDQIELKFVENMPMVTVLDRSPLGFRDVDGVTEKVLEIPGIEGASPFIRNPTLITLERIPGHPRHKAAVAWGIRPEQQETVTPLRKSITPPFTGFDTESLVGGAADLPGLVLGSELGASMYAAIGDIVVLTAPRNVAGRLEEIVGVTEEFMVVGFLNTGMYEFDNSFVYLHLDVAQELFGKPAGADGIGVKVSDMMKAPEMAERIEAHLGTPPYFATDWISLNSQLFEWIRVEKALMFLLLSLITLVASFAVVAILLMMVQDRRRDIGILMSIGVRKFGLVGVFVQLGLFIGLFGIAVGSLLGFGLCRVLDTVGFPLPGDVYFVDTLPVHVKAGDMLLVGAVTLGMSFLATLLPSWLATRFTPVEVLRYE